VRSNHLVLSEWNKQPALHSEMLLLGQ